MENLSSFSCAPDRTGTHTRARDAGQRTTHVTPSLVSDASGRLTSKNGSDLRLRTNDCAFRPVVIGMHDHLKHTHLQVKPSSEPSIQLSKNSLSLSRTHVPSSREKGILRGCSVHIEIRVKWHNVSLIRCRSITREAKHCNPLSRVCYAYCCRLQRPFLLRNHSLIPNPSS